MTAGRGCSCSAAHTRIPTRLLVVAARMGPKNRKLTLTARLRLFWGFQRACWSSSSQPEEEEEFEEEDEAAPSRSSRPAIKITGEKTGCESSIYSFNIHYIYYIAPVAPALTPAPAPACGHPRIPACGHWCVVGAGAGGCVCVRAQPSLTPAGSPPPRARLRLRRRNAGMKMLKASKGFGRVTLGKQVFLAWA